MNANLLMMHKREMQMPGHDSLRNVNDVNDILRQRHRSNEAVLFYLVFFRAL